MLKVRTPAEKQMARDSEMIARIDERTKNQEAWAKAHEIHDDDRFDRALEYTKDQFETQNVILGKIYTKLDTLWDKSNTQNGVFSASRMAMGATWAIIVLAANWFIGRMHG